MIGVIFEAAEGVQTLIVIGYTVEAIIIFSAFFFSFMALYDSSDI